MFMLVVYVCDITIQYRYSVSFRHISIYYVALDLFIYFKLLLYTSVEIVVLPKTWFFGKVCIITNEHLISRFAVLNGKPISIWRSSSMIALI